jgi:23S rRNA (adenine2030-N6)-methyltransferase
VLKHAVLARILVYLHGKAGAFRVVDTHAGAAFYDLSGPEATRSPEWRDGIQRLLTAPITAPLRTLLGPYLEMVEGFNTAGQLTRYPGSPVIARAFLRPQDRLIACELEPNAAATLARNLAGDRRVKAITIDGWTALNAYVPPPERRGLVLIDPPFEQDDEFARLARGLETAHRKWSSGIFLAWYPIKSREQPDALARRLRRSGIPKLLRAEVNVASPADSTRLSGCGLIILNPPWTLEKELAVMLPELAAIMSNRGKGDYRLDWLSGET